MYCVSEEAQPVRRQSLGPVDSIYSVDRRMRLPLCGHITNYTFPLDRNPILFRASPLPMFRLE